MQFRHLDYDDSTAVADLGAAAIDDLLDRGDLQAWAALARAIQAEPAGALADTVLRLCDAHPMYGTSILWRAWIERLRRAQLEPAPMSLSQTRIVAGLTQQQVAAQLGISQSDISKFERRWDMRLSTLRAYLEALGLTLEIRAHAAGGAQVTLRIPGRE